MAPATKVSTIPSCALPASVRSDDAICLTARVKRGAAPDTLPPLDRALIVPTSLHGCRPVPTPPPKQRLSPAEDNRARAAAWGQQGRQTVSLATYGSSSLSQYS